MLTNIYVTVYLSTPTEVDLLLARRYHRTLDLHPESGNSNSQWLCLLSANRVPPVELRFSPRMRLRRPQIQIIDAD